LSGVSFADPFSTANALTLPLDSPPNDWSSLTAYTNRPFALAVRKLGLGVSATSPIGVRAPEPSSNRNP
jgi:hypothetical protein